jgi:hypothetical protein
LRQLYRNWSRKPPVFEGVIDGCSKHTELSPRGSNRTPTLLDLAAVFGS